MFILLNTSACGGNALKKWDKIKNSLPIFEYEVNQKVHKNTYENLDISNAILKGERKFIAAGGDGTINYLLNEILSNQSNTIIDEIQIGTIGLGSSNDFHKPMNSTSLINGIPCKVDFTTTTERDIGCITYIHNEKIIKKYFLINASIGVTAEANYFFNHPNFILKLFKRMNTGAAIIYSALHTIMRYKNIELTMTDFNNNAKIFKVANLAITKSPYISGNLKLNYTPNYEDGLLNVHLLSDTTKIGLIKILHQLQNNKTNTTNAFDSSQSSSILIISERPFKVEFDGEIIRTQCARFSLLKKKDPGMYKLNPIAENKLIEYITKNYCRSPLQINRLQESDSELLDINLMKNDQLAVTTDSIVEEIELGIYKDPYLIGWMTVMVNMSDLAAVGATPVGILVSELLPHFLDDNFKTELHNGINDACEECSTYVIGGDTNFGKQLIISATAIGITKNRMFNTRIGCKPGDVIYTTGKLGTGNAFALTQLADTKHQIEYKPVAKLKTGKAICGVASCCIDTSDGTIAALDQLMRLNNVGIKLDPEWNEKMDANSITVMKDLNLPPWFLLAGQHGEFELVFTVPTKKESILEKIALKHSLNFIRIGEIQRKEGFYLNINDELVKLPTERIRNIAGGINFNLNSYLKSLLEIESSL